MVGVGAGFQGEVDEARALVLGARGAGDDLKLIDRFDRDGVGDDAVVALLVDGRDGDAVDVDGGEEVAGAADDGRAGAALDAGEQGSEGGGIALLAAHLQREVLVGLVLHDAAEHGVGALNRGRGGGDGDLGCGGADLQRDVEAGEFERVDSEVLLGEPLKAVGVRP